MTPTPPTKTPAATPRPSTEVDFRPAFAELKAACDALHTGGGRPSLKARALALVAGLVARLARLGPALAEIRGELKTFLDVAPGAIRGMLSAEEKFRALILAAAGGAPAGLVAELLGLLHVAPSLQLLLYLSPVAIYAADRARRWYQEHPAVALADAQLRDVADTVAGLFDRMRAIDGPPPSQAVPSKTATILPVNPPAKPELPR